MLVMVKVCVILSAPKFKDPGVTVSLGTGAVVVVVGRTLLVLVGLTVVVTPLTDVVVVATTDVVVALPLDVVVVLVTAVPLRATGVPVSWLSGGWCSLNQRVPAHSRHR